MNRPDTTTHKAALRRDARARRRRISAADRARHDSHIRNTLNLRLHAHGASRIGAYFSFDGEPDLRPLLQQLSREGASIALPVLGEAPGEMALADWAPGSVLKKNRFGIEEPVGGKTRQLQDLDWVLLPLAGFDESGNRLGLGGGYYDRLFAGRRDGIRPLRIGIAYACQQLDGLAADPWDIPLHALVTEQGWFSFGP